MIAFLLALYLTFAVVWGAAAYVIAKTDGNDYPKTTAVLVAALWPAALVGGLVALVAGGGRR